MVKLIDPLLHASSLSRSIPLGTKRKKNIGTFSVDDDAGEGAGTEKVVSSPIQAPQKIQSLSLLNISHIKNARTLEIISYGDDLLAQLKNLQYQLLEGEVSYKQLHSLETMFKSLPTELDTIPADLKVIIDDIQVRVAVELAKLSVNRS